MAPAPGRPADRLSMVGEVDRNREAQFEAWLADLQREPYRFDFYQVMRRFAAAHPQLPRPGEALRPADELVRLAQSAELDFAPSPLEALLRPPGMPPRLVQRMFGLIGPNGPLPIHLTEYARNRARHGDRTFLRFIDMLTHRFAMLFYRAWAEAQPIVSMDRPDNRSYHARIGSLVGIGLPTLQNRDCLPDSSKLYFAGRLGRQTRDAEGLLAWIRLEFGVSAEIEQWCGHWMPLMQGDRSRLGRRGGATLGHNAVLGGTVWDVQHKFRIRIGPLRLEDYAHFLPGGVHLPRLGALVRHWVGVELAWDVKLVLAADEVPRFALGAMSAPDAADPGQAVVDGLYEARLVATRPIEGPDGIRLGLVFRLTGPSNGDFEIVQAVPPTVPTLSRVADLKRELAESGHDSVARSPVGQVQPIPQTGTGEVPVPVPAAIPATGGDPMPAAFEAVQRPAGVPTAAFADLIGRRCKIRLHRQDRHDGTTKVLIGCRMGLGYTTWLGRRLQVGDADDLRLNVEHSIAQS